MSCVVCTAPIAGEPVYPNAFERARRIYACCSAACAERFDPDVHWIPAQPPAVLDDAEERKLLRVLRERIANGDQPTVLVREMLVAGLPPHRLRLQLGEQATASEQEKSRAASFMLFGIFSIRRRKRDKRDPKALAAAAREIDHWPFV